MEELKVIHLFKYVQLKRESNIAPIYINKNCVRKERIGWNLKIVDA